MSLDKKEFTAFFKTFFVIIGPEGPSTNENEFLIDFVNQYVSTYYTSIHDINNAIIDMEYFDMVAILQGFNEVEKDVVKIYWAKLLKCNGRTIPSDDKINSMVTIAMDSGIDISNIGKYF